LTGGNLTIMPYFPGWFLGKASPTPETFFFILPLLAGSALKKVGELRFPNFPEGEGPSLLGSLGSPFQEFLVEGSFRATCFLRWLDNFLAIARRKFGGFTHWFPLLWDSPVRLNFPALWKKLGPQNMGAPNLEGRGSEAAQKGGGPRQKGSNH